VGEAIEGFEIRVPDAVLADLRERLARTRWPDQIEGSGWDYGTDLAYLKELCAYWRDGFDWRAQEERLNRLAQFRTEIDGQPLHFVHQRSSRADALPLLVLHGWPGSICEFAKIIGPLTEPAAHGGDARDAFHLICPSLPGYGFSGPTRTPGWDIRRVAEVTAKLVARLGYDRYGAQGGDWGAVAATQIGVIDAAHLVGIHLNLVIAGPPDGVEDPMQGVTPQEREWLADMARFDAEESGYQRIQGTRPQTLGYGLNDSPAGLAAWIVEKFRAWSDCDGDPEHAFTRDRLLTNVMTYWVTGTATSAARLYREHARARETPEYVTVPTGVARYPREILRYPRAWVERSYHVTHWADLPRGGHFAAMEQPDLFVGDLRAFLRTLG
jgi:pimeloyl-ACP methyl ester carboxylesterase